MTFRTYLFVTVLILVSLVELGSAQNSLTISRPRNGSTVPQQGDTIRFNCKARIDDALVPVVFVRDPIGQWWPWLTAASLDNNHQVWQLEDVQFGIEKDRGKNFEIQVLVIPQSLIDNGIPVGSGRLFIEAGGALPNRTMVTVLRPKFPTRSNVVRVTRR